MGRERKGEGTEVPKGHKGSTIESTKTTAPLFSVALSSLLLCVFLSLRFYISLSFYLSIIFSTCPVFPVFLSLRCLSPLRLFSPCQSSVSLSFVTCKGSRREGPAALDTRAARDMSLWRGWQPRRLAPCPALQNS